MSGVAASCDLCGLGVGLRPVRVRGAYRELRFCCGACRAIYEMLHGLDGGPVPAGPGTTRAPDHDVIAASDHEEGGYASDATRRAHDG